jgi:hypothetical protein
MPFTILDDELNQVYKTEEVANAICKRFVVGHHFPTSRLRIGI